MSSAQIDDFVPPSLGFPRFRVNWGNGWVHYERDRETCDRLIRRHGDASARLETQTSLTGKWKTLPALLLGAFLALGVSGCQERPRDLVTVAQYPDGSFSVDVYDAEGELATTLHLPADARMADAFPAE